MPILAGERVIGTIDLEPIKKNAFNESDVRLLSTVASNMGVALENARLFDETKRLLAETDERAAELAIINEIGAALAKQLDFDAIIELIGQRISTMFAAHSMFIALVRRGSRQITFPYRAARGEPYHTEPFELGAGLTSTVIRRASRFCFERSRRASAADASRGRARSRVVARRAHPCRRSRPRRHRAREPGARCL